MPVIHDDEHTAADVYPCQSGLSVDAHNIQKGERYRKLYGSSGTGDKPQSIKVCLGCYQIMREMSAGKRW